MAWQLVYNAVKAEAPDTQVRIRYAYSVSVFLELTQETSTDDLVASNRVRPQTYSQYRRLTFFRISEDEDEYEQYYPAGYAPDMVGLTYEPTKKDTVSKFLKKVRPFHDEFASDESPFLLTRTAPSINKVSEKGRIDFLNLITHKDVAKKLPYYLAATYHNFNDNVDKRIITLKREPQLKVGKKDSMNKKVRDSKF